MSVFFIQLAIALVDTFQEVERNTPTVCLAYFIAFRHSCRRKISEDVSNQAVVVYYVPFHDKGTSDKTPNTTKTSGEENHKRRHYQQKRDGFVNAGFEGFPSEMEFNS